MKKLLFASTALVATAGVAAADISLSGSAEVGIFGGSNTEDQFHTDLDINFSMTGETDGGLAFGASVDLDETDDGDVFNPEDDGGATWFLAFGGLRLDMGDTDGAFDAAMQEVALAAGSIQDNETAHAGYSGNGGFSNDFSDEQLGMGLDGGYDGQIARVSYNFSGFTGHFSVEADDTGEDDPIWGVGVRWVGDLAGLSIGVGLGYQEANDVADVWGISLDTTFDFGLSAAINYSELSVEEDINGEDELTHLGIGFGYTWEALSVGVNWGQYDIGDDITNSGWGIAASYDLGGGLAVQAGYGNSSLDDDFATNNGLDDDFSNYSFGVSMSF